MINIDDRLIAEDMRKIGPNAFATLMAISIHLSTKENGCFPSHEQLMCLTGLGKNTVYDALKTLRDHDLLKSEQAKDFGNKQFGRRQFRVTTRFISIFVTAEQAAPMLEPDTYEDQKPLPKKPYPVNWETGPFPKKAASRNLGSLTNYSIIEEVEEEEEKAKIEISTSKQKKNEHNELLPAAAAPPPPRETPHWATSTTTQYNPGTPAEWRARMEEEAGGTTTYQAWGMALSNLGVKLQGPDDLKARIADFEIHRATSGVTYQRESDYRQHFKNWISRRRQIEAAPQQPTRPTNYRQNQPAPAPQPRNYKGPVYGQ